MRVCLNYRHICMVLFILIILLFNMSKLSAKTIENSDINSWISELKKSTKPTKLVVISSNIKNHNKTTYRKWTSRIRYKTIKNHRKNNPFNIYGKATRISVDFYKADLHNVFRLLGQVSGKNIVVDEGVKGTITLSMRNVPWPFVLQVIENLKNLQCIERYNTLLIYPKNKSIEWNPEGVEGATGELILGNNPSFTNVSNLSVITKKVSNNILPPKSSEAFYLISRAEDAQQKGDYEIAKKLFEKAFTLWPQNSLLAEKIAAICLGKLHDNLYALKWAKKALEINPYSSLAASYAAIALAHMGKDDEARAYFERSLLAHNPPASVYYNYALFLEKQGDYKQALRILTKYEKLSGPSIYTMLIRAKIYNKLGLKHKAIKEYNAILLAGPDTDPNLKEYAKIQIKKIKSELKKHNKKSNSNTKLNSKGAI